ncbi:hypothetical protein [Nocardioides jishulii]|uniref:Uncharacterized protein n=1 Tax=Nocardioides jishulii TaxID=2575440 RepID=A0A4V5TJY4_9ACTN|nr:hypothetical protein [Nocardioides jishulii]QCX26920.1 hypothetical protein FCL41_04770 [Nocardioides jishulii]TKI61403.1 hypothetical protein FC770_11405 [Nocardioides jishulii]
MSSDHKRPLYAFAVVALLCALFVGNGLRSDAFVGMLQVVESPRMALPHLAPREDAPAMVSDVARTPVSGSATRSAPETTAEAKGKAPVKPRSAAKGDGRTSAPQVRGHQLGRDQAKGRDKTPGKRHPKSHHGGEGKAHGPHTSHGKNKSNGKGDRPGRAQGKSDGRGKAHGKTDGRGKAHGKTGGRGKAHGKSDGRGKAHGKSRGHGKGGRGHR